MKWSFHPLAQQELNEACDYYNSRIENLGLEFAREVYSSIQNIIQFPHAWTPLSENTRRCLTNRFPYGIIYQITDDEIIIIAVMHLNREPDYWRKRTS